MAAGTPPPDDDDPAALFRDAIGPVRKLPEVPPPPRAPPPRPRAHMAARDEADARSEFQRSLDERGLEGGDAMSYRREQVPQHVLQRLARGQYAVQDELDLHHADVVLAEAMLRQFLREAHEAGHACVSVVHGKGLHAPGRVATLKNLVDRILRQRGDVLAFHSAPAARGGTGAVLVLLAPR